MPAYYQPTKRIVGSFLGDPTISDLRDLVAAKDVEMGELDKAAGSFLPVWAASDVDAAAAWEAEWNALLSRYAPARVTAGARIDSVLRDSLVSPDYVPAVQEYEGLLRALQKEPGKTSPGDHIDLVGRIVDAGARMNYKVPQPVGNDVDLNIFLRASKVLKEIDPGLIGKGGFSTLETVGILGALTVAALLLVRR